MRQCTWMLLVVAAACAPDPEVQTLADRPDYEIGPPPDCWAVGTGSWAATPNSALALGSESDSGSVPWILRFDTLPPPIISPDRPDASATETFVEGAWRDFPFQRWWVTRDSLFIDHPAAFSGTTLRLVARDNGFTGIATSHTDVLRPGEESRFRYAAARMRPTDCPE